MSGPRIGSLCSGYGGLDMAVMDAVPGAEVAWHAQYEPPDKKGKPDLNQWAARILEYRFPGVPNHGDITAIDYAAVEPVDILTAGFPCQDISLAGGRAGLLAGNRSGLWAHVARAIAALRPSLVFIENVRSLTSARAHSDLESCPRCVGDGKRRPALRALGAVLGDLAGLGFDAEWVCVPASGVGACHKRERTFVLAWPATEDTDVAAGGQWRLTAPGQAEGGRSRADAGRRGRTPAPDAGRYARPEDNSHVVAASRSGRGDVWGRYAPAIRRWEVVLGRPAPAPVDGRGRLAPSFAEWMMGPPAGWVTDVPNIPRSAQLKALGNGVVPQQGAAAYRFLAERRAASAVLTESVPAPAISAAPLFLEVPVGPTVNIPLGAPPSWHRVVEVRAQLQCECTGQCGVAHKTGRCLVKHQGWHNKRTAVLVLAPKPAGLLLPLSKKAALADDAQMAWCQPCLARAEKVAAPPK